MDLSVEGKSERIPPGSHICQLYSKVNEIPKVTAHLMRVGLSSSEKCMFAAAPAQVKEFREEFRKFNFDIDALISAGQLVLCEEREAIAGRWQEVRSLFLTFLAPDFYCPGSTRRLAGGTYFN